MSARDDLEDEAPRRAVLTGRHDLLLPTLAARLLRTGHRVLVPAPPLLPGLSVLHTWAWPDADGPGAPEVVEHDPEDPDVPRDLSSGVDVVLHLAGGTTGQVGLGGRSTSTLDALFALRVAEINAARLVVVAAADDPHHAATLEGLLAGYRSAHPVDAVLVRVLDCYGPHPAGVGDGVVARMLAQAAATGRVVVHGGDSRRHRPCFVDDVVDGLLELCRADAADAADGTDGAGLHLAAATALGTRELAEAVCRATGADLKVVGPAAADGTAAGTGPAAGGLTVVLPGGPAVSIPATGASGAGAGPAGGPHGWSPRVDLAEGLRRCLADARTDGTVVLPTSRAAPSSVA